MYFYYFVYDLIQYVCSRTPKEKTHRKLLGHTFTTVSHRKPFLHHLAHLIEQIHLIKFIKQN